MKKVMILLVLLIVVVSGCDKGVKNDNFVMAFNSTGNAEQIMELNNDYVDRAILANNVSMCEDYEGGQKYLCYYQFAFSKKDVSYCNVTDMELRDIQLCYDTYAKMAKDYTACQNNMCYSYVAREIQNPDICLEIDSYGKEIKKMCYWQIARETQNPEICLEIDDIPREIQRCQYESGKR